MAALDINILQYKDLLKIAKNPKGKVTVFDPVRKKHIILQPEELVRQLLLHYLINEKKYSKSFIKVEKMLTLNDMPKRYDIIVLDRKLYPFLLVECKSHKTNIDQQTFDQIAMYNLALKAPYLLVTNGIQTYCCTMDFDNKSYEFLDAVPDFPN